MFKDDSEDDDSDGKAEPVELEDTSSEDSDDFAKVWFKKDLRGHCAVYYTSPKVFLFVCFTTLETIFFVWFVH